MDPAVARSVDAWERMRPLSWRGVPCQQFPSDMLRYAEIIHELRPGWVLECGTGDGGTALFLADVASRYGGQVITIDRDPRDAAVTAWTRSAWLSLIKGDAVAPDIVAQVTELAGDARGLVLLDSDHTSAQILAELEAYAPLAGYLIVQDTLMGYLPQYPDNPRLAVEKWLPGHPEFTQDPEPDPTNHPGGWLRRVAG